MRYHGDANREFRCFAGGDVLSRSLLGFLLFLVALAMAAVLGVWWLGPGVVKLGLDEDRRGQPYYALQLSRSAAGDDFERRFAELAQLDGATLLWRGGLTRLLDGRVEDEWQQAMLVAFPQGGNLVQMITGTDYRTLAEGRTFVLLGTQAVPDDVATSATFVLGLLGRREPESAAIRFEDLTQDLQNFGGRIAWQAAVDPLAGEAAWTDLLLLAFADANQAQAWFREPASVTERALVSKTLERQAWLLFSAGYGRG